MADLDARSRIVDHLARLTALASSARGRRAGDAAAVAVEALASDARSLATAAGELERAERDLARARRVLSLATSASAGRRRRRNGNGGAGGGRGGDDASSSVGISSPTPRASCAAASAACEWRGACVGRFHRHHAALGRALRHDPHSLPQKEIDAAVEAERDGGRASARELRGGGGGGGGGAGNRRRRQIEFTPGGGIMPRRARYVSPWAKHAANAVHVISDAVDALVGDGGGLVFTIGEGSRSKSKSTSKPSPELALPWLADRVDSVGSVVANWTTHRPKLRPTGVTLSDLCLLHSDVVHVDDALTRAAASFAARGGGGARTRKRGKRKRRRRRRHRWLRRRRFRGDDRVRAIRHQTRAREAHGRHRARDDDDVRSTLVGSAEGRVEDEGTDDERKKQKRRRRSASGASYTLVPIRPRSRGERRSLRTFAGVSLRPPLAFNARHRRLSTPTDAFQLHPDVRLYRTTLKQRLRTSPSASARRSSRRCATRCPRWIRARRRRSAPRPRARRRRAFCRA